MSARTTTQSSPIQSTTDGQVLDGRAPGGDPATAWGRRKLEYRLVSPLNRRKFTVIVVGTGLAGAGVVVLVAAAVLTAIPWRGRDDPAFRPWPPLAEEPEPPTHPELPRQEDHR